MKYRCNSCGWTGDVLGDRKTDDDGDVECCPLCDSDDIEVNVTPVSPNDKSP